MKLAIIGARAKWLGDEGPRIRALVFRIVSETAPDTIIISGESPGGGVDAYAHDAATAFRRTFCGFPPNVTSNMTREQYANACHSRNQTVVDACDSLIAIVAPGCKGTWDAIRRAKKAGKLNAILRPMEVADGKSVRRSAEELTCCTCANRHSMNAIVAPRVAIPAFDADCPVHGERL